MTSSHDDDVNMEDVLPEQGETGTLRVGDEEADRRLDRWLADRFGGHTRSRMKEIIKRGNVTREGTAIKNPALKVRPGDLFEITMPEIAHAIPLPENIPLEILYEDLDLIVINKPAGLVVHPAAGNWTGTLVNALLHHCADSLSGVGGVARPGIVHRLDKDTSGVMVVAKNDEAHQGLTENFSTHDIERVYLALTIGAPRPGIGSVDAHLGRSSSDRKKMAVVKPQSNPSARRAVTHYRKLASYGIGRAKLPGDSVASLISCQLETGRTHQIRVHMAHIGHPLIGDQLYGRGPGLAGLKPGEAATDAALEVLAKFKRQALHATILGFEHPVTGKPLRFEVEPPEDFQRVVAVLEQL
ncbi:MAG: RluA family pseudouridine synthase [Parvularculaceae bacterium]